MDGIGVVGAVAEPGRDRDAALRRQDQLKLQLPFHHGVLHDLRSSLVGAARTGPVRRERGEGRSHYAGPGKFFRGPG
ncbi:hypothetical protein GCM10010521_24470 [Streptomyces rameus]|uniref:Uncharacterized protein n=1 Tax=Streptomyces rameus TaxID=68261 RepID=A0ABP6N628_9ACTN